MTPALFPAALFPGLANLEASAPDLTMKDKAAGEESWLAVLLAAAPLAWLTPPPLLGPAAGEPPPSVPFDPSAPALPPAAAMPLLPRVLPETSWPLPSPPAPPFDAIPPPPLPAIESPAPSLVEANLVPAPPLSDAAALPPAAEPVRAPDSPPDLEAFRLEVKWQPPAAEPGRSAPMAAPKEPAEPSAPPKSDPPALSRPPAVAAATNWETADPPADRQSDGNPEPERHPAPPPPPAPRRSAPLEAAEPAPPVKQNEGPVRPVRLVPTVEAPAPPPPPARAPVADSTPPPPSVAPAELHGLERAIERAELRQSPQTSELNLWMRPEHLGKVAVRLIERAGVVEIAVRAETPLARGWLAEGLPTLFDRLQERGFETSPVLRGAEAGLEGGSGDHPHGRRPPSRDGQKRRDHHETALFSLEPGETS